MHVSLSDGSTVKLEKCTANVLPVVVGKSCQLCHKPCVSNGKSYVKDLLKVLKDLIGSLRALTRPSRASVSLTTGGI